MNAILFLQDVAFGKNLRLWRERKGLSLEDLSERSKLAVSTLSQIENEKQRPHNSTRRNLAEALGITMDEISAPPPSRPDGSRPTKEELFEGLTAYYADGELTDEQILDYLATLREERKRRGLKP